MSRPKDPSKLPAWWRPKRTIPRNLYEVFGSTYNAQNKVINVIARDVVEAAKITTDQFCFIKIITVTLKMEGVWVPERL